MLHLLIVLRVTAVRIGEGLGLQWGDLDLHGDPPTLTVERTLLDQRPGVSELTGPTKGSDVRRIAMHPVLVEVMKTRRSWLASPPKPTDFVFATGRKGRPLTPHNARSRVRHIARTAGTEETGDLCWITPHSLRRTLATLAARRWGDDAASALLGHSTTKTVTQRHYIQRSTTVLDPRPLFEPAIQDDEQTIRPWLVE